MATFPRILPNTEIQLAPSKWVTSDQVEFAYWVPNVSGGLVITTLPMDTDWSPKANIKYALDAEQNGFVTALAQTRWLASYGADHQHEAFVISSAILAKTKTLELITAVHPGLWHPGIVAKMQASLDVISGGRTSINVVSGWFKAEFLAYGFPWLEHGERYRRSEEFIRILKGMWYEDEFTLYGDFYQINGPQTLPRPLHRIVVFQGGNSHDARRLAGRCSDMLFMNGNTNAGWKSVMDGSREAAAASGRDPSEIQFGANGFAIVRPKMQQAVQQLRDIISNADVEAVKALGEAFRGAGRESKEGEGLWTNSSFEDLVQYNDGFKTGLIGTPEMVADRIMQMRALGLKCILTGFLHYNTELKEFGRTVIPLVREKEEALRKSARIKRTKSKAKKAA